MKLKLFIAVLAAQCAWLLGITVAQEHALDAGKVILLETERIDPRDLLRGDYLILNYKISNVPRNIFSPPLQKNPTPPEAVFVAVAPGPGHFYRVTRAGTKEFEPVGSEVILRGVVSAAWWNVDDIIHLDYGIGRFYVAEGAGQPHGVLTAEVVVSSSGRATIKEVLLDGKPYAEAMATAVNGQHP